MEFLTIEKLKESKLTEEGAAYANGEFQAKNVINETPTYRFLCELHDMAKSFEADKNTNTDYIDGLDEYPAALRYQVIRGFYVTITKIAGMTSPCSNGGECNPLCNLCENGMTAEDMKQVGIYTGVNAV